MSFGARVCAEVQSTNMEEVRFMMSHRWLCTNEIFKYTSFNSSWIWFTSTLSCTMRGLSQIFPTIPPCVGSQQIGHCLVGKSPPGPHLTSASGCSPLSPAPLSSAQLCGQPSMISHPASQYWLGVLEAYTKARREVTDCVLQRTLSLHSTREGQQNFLAQEMETTTRAGSIWLDSLKR